MTNRFLPRLLTLVLLLWASYLIACASSPTARGPAKPRLNLQFNGLCDFIFKSDGTLHVVMPDASDVPEKERAHEAFIRVGKKVALINPPDPPDETSGNYRIWLTQGSEVTLMGSFVNGPLERDSSFDKVPDMVKDLHQTLDPDYAKKKLASQILLVNGGRLSAKAHGGNPNRAFAPNGVTPDPAACQPGKTFAGLVTLSIGLQENATDRTFTLSWGQKKLTFPYEPKSEITVRLGNLAKKDRGAENDSRGWGGELWDVDFVHHYMLAAKEEKNPLVPAVCPPYLKTAPGSWYDCYAAQWQEVPTPSGVSK
jgi:hypothetical protein